MSQFLAILNHSETLSALFSLSFPSVPIPHLDSPLHTHTHTHAHTHTHTLARVHIVIDLLQLFRRDENAEGTHSFLARLSILPSLWTWSRDVYRADIWIYACKMERACSIPIAQWHQWSRVWKIALESYERFQCSTSWMSPVWESCSWFFLRWIHELEIGIGFNEKKKLTQYKMKRKKEKSCFSFGQWICITQFKDATSLWEGMSIRRSVPLSVRPSRVFFVWQIWRFLRLKSPQITSLSVIQWVTK